MSVAPVRSVGGDDDGLADVAVRVLAELDQLVPHMGEAYREEIPDYAELSDDEMEREVLATSRRFVTDFFRRIAEGRQLEQLDLDALTVAGGRRLDMGVSLDSAMHAFRIAGREAWWAVVAATPVDEQHLLAELAAQWIDYVDRASSAFARGYLAASHEHLRRLDARRRAIVEALLHAADPGDVAAIAAQHSVNVAKRYTPVLLDGDDVSARVDRALTVSPDDSLAGSRGDRVLLLLPGPPEDVDALRVAADADLAVVGDAAGPGPELLTAVHAVERVMEAAVRSGRADAVLTTDDLLLEQLMGASPRIAATLRRRILEPLAAHDTDGIFVSTLRRYLQTGSVPQTAEDEHVHPNTAAYRLRRVEEITGLDPRVPADAALLVLALSAGDDR